MPDNIRISEVRAVDVEHGVSFVWFERVAIVVTGRDGLVLSALDATWVLSKSVDGDDAVVLVGEEAGGVVWVQNCRTAEDKLHNLSACTQSMDHVDCLTV